MCPHSGVDYAHREEQARGSDAGAGGVLGRRRECPRGQGWLHGPAYGGGARGCGASQVPAGRVQERESGGGVVRPVDGVPDCDSESESGMLIGLSL